MQALDFVVSETRHFRGYSEPSGRIPRGHAEVINAASVHLNTGSGVQDVKLPSLKRTADAVKFMLVRDAGSHYSRINSA